MTLGRPGADAGSAPAGVGGTKGQSGRGGRALSTSPVACGRLTPRPPPGKQEPCMRVKGNASDGLSLVALWLTPGSAVWTDGAAASSEAAGRGRGTLPVPPPPRGDRDSGTYGGDTRPCPARSQRPLGSDRFSCTPLGRPLWRRDRQGPEPGSSPPRRRCAQCSGPASRDASPSGRGRRREAGGGGEGGRSLALSAAQTLPDLGIC